MIEFVLFLGSLFSCAVSILERVSLCYSEIIFFTLCSLATSQTVLMVPNYILSEKSFPKEAALKILKNPWIALAVVFSFYNRDSLHELNRTLVKLNSEETLNLFKRDIISREKTIDSMFSIVDKFVGSDASPKHNSFGEIGSKTVDAYTANIATTGLTQSNTNLLGLEVSQSDVNLAANNL
ncbi:MAG: hypothetical protein SFT93_00490 [Rickettsiaceae bacterium]|nr:hypothetical protein [Rickettsiaceae bacterium]